MILRACTLPLTVIIFCIVGLSITACPKEWFGTNCEYKCHCGIPDKCTSTGECTDGKCATGWFGPACQYQDLFSLPQVSKSSLTATNLTDRDDTTCLTTTSALLAVSFNMTYAMTWIRLVGKNIDQIKNIALTFNDTNNVVTQCSKTIIQDRTLDIICDVEVLVKNINFTGDGVKSLCSLYISGGRNVAIRQNTSQSSNFTDRYSANLAVDGNSDSDFNQGSCTHTLDYPASNWNVTFSRPQLANRYVIYNRNSNGGRLLDFYLSSMKPDKAVVFTYSFSPVEKPIYSVTTSTELVSFVTIFTNVSVSQFLTLCEVEIYGDSACPQGTFGLDCSKTCNCFNKSESCFVAIGGCTSGCGSGYLNYDCQTACVASKWGPQCKNNCSGHCLNGSPCNITNGWCDAGCEPGYTQENCSYKCPALSWGNQCFNKCSEHCLNETCDYKNGTCDHGCEPGYWGPRCQEECPSERWGQNCVNLCNTHCRNNSCNSFSGTCNGCDDGYTGEKCDQKCTNLTWGFNCQNNCSKNCVNGSCNNTNGFCTLGCLPGYTGDNCSNACPEFKWGAKCLNNCSKNCANETCDHRDGKCDFGCLAGYMGVNCAQSCPIMSWGENCSKKCGGNCVNKTCNRYNGTCDKGCQPGYLGNLCDEPCEASKWGPQCKNNCSGHCLNGSPCNITNGWCDAGCEPGYTQENCSYKCPALRWGKQCLSNCSQHCHNKTCDFRTGTCDHGCETGYFGERCQLECPLSKWGEDCHLNCSQQCTNQSCSKSNGTCDYGCIAGFKGQLCLEKLVEEETSASAIVVPIIVVIIILLLIIAAVIIYRRRRQRTNKDNEEQPSKEMLFIKPQNVSNGYEYNKSNQNDQLSKSVKEIPLNSGHENTYSNIVLPATKDTSIAVPDLNDFMRHHESEFFSNQFKNIPLPTNVSMEVGQSDANKHKNRYKNICTYDHSRVHLMINTANQEGDYINASYVEGYVNKEKFIASQGPNKVILNDFVRMLCEQKVEKIVMLTNLIEEGQVKCERYWPEEGKVVFGSIKVRLASTQVFADYTIRKLELRNKDEPIQHMTQYHFTSWPDKGVPLTPWSLVDFQQRVTSEPTTSPVVVHCSAGVGRTGTFIALCNVIKEAEATGQIDFFKTLVKLRQDRVMMIQTPAQYEFLHRAAQVAIVCMGTTITSRDITDRIQRLEQKDFTGKTKMEIEYKDVCKVSEDFTKHIKEVESTEQESNVYENNVSNSDIAKNRFPNILPEKVFSAFLTPDGSQSGDYINAVIVPSLKKKDQQILSQLPLATTVTELWRLVWDYKVSLIVEFEFHLKSSDPTIAEYLPPEPGQSLTLGTNEIHLISAKRSALWEESQLSIRAKKRSAHTTPFGELKATHLKFFSTELDVKNLLLLIKQIRSLKSPGDERVLYLCRDGATYSGLACVLTLLLDRMDNDLCLTVPLVVGTIKSIRSQVIPTLEQYKVLYQVLHRYNETTSSYTNFGDYQQMNLTVENNLDKSSNMDNENIYSNT